MYKYFENINTLKELREQYKELLKQYHHDNGGDVAVLQKVNAERPVSGQSQSSGSARACMMQEILSLPMQLLNNLRYRFLPDKRSSK